MLAARHALPFWQRFGGGTNALAALLLAIHAVLLVGSIPYNSETDDEFPSLLAGVSYWEFGQFAIYHHNPPLVKLLFAMPTVLVGVPADWSEFSKGEGMLNGRHPDSRARWVSQADYLRMLTAGRLVVAVLSVGCGWLVFRWSRRLFGGAGGLLSLGLWTFCPFALGQGGQVTTDVGTTAFGLAATYAFWKYLRRPSVRGVALAGLLLGLAEGTKFTMVLLPVIWGLLVPIKLLAERRERNGGSFEPVASLRPAVAVGHALLLCGISLTTLNSLYLFEGTGQRLGQFEFRSRALTRDVHGAGVNSRGALPRVNRFRGTLVAWLPVPLPQQYVLGMDNQKWDIDTRGSTNYLRGELREDRQPGWWYYYLYGLLVKLPLGTLAMVAMTPLAWLVCRRCRVDFVTEATLALPVLVFLTVISANTGMNKHVRYAMPILPFLFVAAGRLAALPWRRTGVVLTLLVAANAASVLRVHPYYLSYFNEAAGGPVNGWKHLGSSNIDSGQGLIALKTWLDRYAPGRTVRLAYSAKQNPETLGISFRPAIVDGPTPGLYAVGANYLIGTRSMRTNVGGGLVDLKNGSLTWLRKFTPVATPGYCFFVYDLSLEQVNALRARRGLPLLEAGQGPDQLPDQNGKGD